MSAYLIVVILAVNIFAVFADWTFDADWKQRQSGRDSQCQYSVTR